MDGRCRPKRSSRVGRIFLWEASHLRSFRKMRSPLQTSGERHFSVCLQSWRVVFCCHSGHRALHACSFSRHALSPPRAHLVASSSCHPFTPELRPSKASLQSRTVQSKPGWRLDCHLACVAPFCTSKAATHPTLDCARLDVEGGVGALKKGPSSSWRCPRPPNGRLSTNGTSRPHQHLWGAGGLFGSARFGSHSDLLSPSQGQLSTCVGATWRLGRRGPRCLPHQRD